MPSDAAELVVDRKTPAPPAQSGTAPAALTLRLRQTQLTTNRRDRVRQTRQLTAAISHDQTPPPGMLRGRSIGWGECTQKPMRSGWSIRTSKPAMRARPDRATIGCVGLLAMIAGTVSYLHMHLLVELHGQPGWVAALTPLSVDGMIVAASTTLLADSRSGGRGGFLPWALLVVGSAASLAANVAVAQPTATGR